MLFKEGSVAPFLCFPYNYAHQGKGVAISPEEEFLLAGRTNGMQKTGTLEPRSNIHFSPAVCGQD